MPRTIALFMWGYQSHFQISAKVGAEALFGTLDPGLDPHVLLVGSLLDAGSGRAPLCVDPEDGDVLLDALVDLPRHVVAARGEDPESSMVQSHPLAESRREERVGSRAFSEGVARALGEARPDRAFYASFPQKVEHHLVTAVLHLDRAAVQAHPSVQESRYLHRFTVPTSLLGATIDTFLAQCTDRMSREEPGSWPHDRPVADLLRDAGRLFMTNPGGRLTQGVPNLHLFDQFNTISALRYEGAEGRGRLLLTDEDHVGVRPRLLLRDSVSFRAERATRKLVEMATSDLDLLATPMGVYGLGTPDSDHDPSDERVFEVAFLRGNAWELRHNGLPLMRVVGGVPELPAEPVQRGEFEALARRVLGETPDLDLDALWTAVEAARRQRHGTLFVVSTGAAMEAQRMAGQSTPVAPVALTSALVDAVSAIDGAVLVDPAGTCHAVGVILDGLASDGGDPGRGARFNSAHRYVTTAHEQFGHRTLAVVVSEDGMVNVLPALRSQLDRSVLSAHLDDLDSHRQSPLESRTLYLRTVEWIRKNAFYLNAEQCVRANEAIAEIEQAWVEQDPQGVQVRWPQFEQNSGFDPSHLID